MVEGADESRIIQDKLTALPGNERKGPRDRKKRCGPEG